LTTGRPTTTYPTHFSHKNQKNQNRRKAENEKNIVAYVTKYLVHRVVGLFSILFRVRTHFKNTRTNMASIILEDGSSFRQTSLLLPEDVIRGIKQYRINKRVICEKALRIAIEQAEEGEIPWRLGNG
jgi:hypothetical protein